MRHYRIACVFLALVLCFCSLVKNGVANQKKSLNISQEEFCERFMVASEMWAGKLGDPIFEKLSYSTIIRYPCTTYVSFELKIDKSTGQTISLMVRCHFEWTDGSSGDQSWGLALLPKIVDPTLDQSDINSILDNLKIDYWGHGNYSSLTKNGILYKYFYSSSTGSILSAEPASDDISQKDHQDDFTYEQVVTQTLDFNTMSLDELITLKEQINLAFWSLQEWQEVVVPPGVYEIGVHIPEAHWTVTATDGTSPHITFFSELNDSKTGSNGYIIDSVSLTSKTYKRGFDENRDIEFFDFELKKGKYIEIESGSVIFTPYSGKPDLGFK